MIYRCATLLLCLFIAGCGGGNESGVDLSANFAGTWRGKLSSGESSCMFSPVQDANYQVSADRNDVNLKDESGHVFLGSIISDTSFQVELGSDKAFEIYEQIVFTNVANGTATVERKYSWSRPGGCLQIWTGVMTRN